MAVSVNETEIKYDAPAGASLPRLDDLPKVAGTSGPDEERLEAEYYDTGDLRLIRAGITLRRRRGGDDAGWHLKLPLGAQTRREIRLPLGRTGRRVPGELARLVRVHTRGKPLGPTAQLTTRRQRVILLDQAGNSLAKVVADDVSARTLGDTTALSSWREIEVELTGGDLDQTPGELVIGPVQADVQRHFAPVRAEARTRLLAALDSRRYFSLLDELDKLLTEPPLTSKAAKPAAKVLPAAARRPYRQIRRRMHRARDAGGGQSADAALHQARKAAKRARYASEAMTPAIGKKARRFARQMKKVQSVLGDHHDTVIACQVDRELGISAYLSRENAFSYGLLYGRDACAGEQLKAQAWQTWKRASRPRYRRWMH